MLDIFGYDPTKSDVFTCKKMQKGGTQKNWMITSTIKSCEGGCIAIEHLE
jgi:hypothetical protein